MLYGASYSPIYAHPYLDIVSSLDDQILLWQTCLNFTWNLLLSQGDTEQSWLEFKWMSVMFIKHQLKV